MWAQGMPVFIRRTGFAVQVEVQRIRQIEQKRFAKGSGKFGSNEIASKHILLK